MRTPPQIKIRQGEILEAYYRDQAKQYALLAEMLAGGATATERAVWAVRTAGLFEAPAPKRKRRRRSNASI